MSDKKVTGKHCFKGQYWGASITKQRVSASGEQSKGRRDANKEYKGKRTEGGEVELM